MSVFCWSYRFFLGCKTALLLAVPIFQTGCAILGPDNRGASFPPATIASEAQVPSISADEVVVAPDIITPTLKEIPPTATPDLPTPALYSGIPTPDAPHYGEAEYNRIAHSVQSGETLSIISSRYNLPLEELISFNGITEADTLVVGQTLFVPASLDGISPTFKIIPDSELVYGPTVGDFDLYAYLQRYHPNSPLFFYSEAVEGRPMSGVDIVQLVSIRYSVNPRLLLAMIDYRSGWVSQGALDPNDNPFPLGHVKDGFEGLNRQLSWAANRVNLGFYGRDEGGLTSITFADRTQIAIDPTLNHGTAGIQYWLAAHEGANAQTWFQEISENGFIVSYQRLFGSPFGFRYDEPLVPNGLQQPRITFPWEPGVPWYFTGGPHGGWAGGSAWAALDFAPDKDQRGCYVSNTWVTAPADGLIVHSDLGGILLDLDGDGDPGTGWVIVHWHVDQRERVPVGKLVREGDRIGHASCEGGFSSGTHIHFARRYNGQWISADGDLPFVIDGWVSQGTGNEYDGFLVNGNRSVEACVCAEADINEIIK